VEIALIIVVVTVIVAAGIYSWRAAAQRKKDLAAWAAAKGLSYADTKDPAIRSRFPAFKCLDQGDNRYAYNVMSGQWSGRDVLAFDYHYETHSTDSKGHRTTSNHYFSAAIVGSQVPLQPLSIRPEGFFDKITEFLGVEDIDFESAEFSRTFFVKAPDRKWAYDVLHARTMEFLLAQPRFSIQFDTRSVIIHRQGTFQPPEFQAAIETVCGILDRLPEYLIRQQRGQ
jgi:hypothetical protein